MWVGAKREGKAAMGDGVCGSKTRTAVATPGGRVNGSQWHVQECVRRCLHCTMGTLAAQEGMYYMTSTWVTQVQHKPSSRVMCAHEGSIHAGVCFAGSLLSSVPQP